QAVLASLDAIVNLQILPSRIHLYTAGSPRVGNKEFSDFVESFDYASRYRVVNRYDIVPRLPPTPLGFRHYTSQRWIDPSNNVRKCNDVDPSRDSEDSDCANSVALWNLISFDHPVYFGIPMTDPPARTSTAPPTRTTTTTTSTVPSSTTASATSTLLSSPTAPPSLSNPSSDPSTSSSNTASNGPSGALIGGVTSGVVLLLLAVLGIWMFVLTPRRQRKDADLEKKTTLAALESRDVPPSDSPVVVAMESVAAGVASGAAEGAEQGGKEGKDDTSAEPLLLITPNEKSLVNLEGSRDETVVVLQMNEKSSHTPSYTDVLSASSSTLPSQSSIDTKPLVATTTSTSQSSLESTSAAAVVFPDLELKPYTSWTSSDLCTWLRLQGFQKDVVEMFRDNCVDGSNLHLIDKQVLRDDLGVKNFAVRAELLGKIKGILGDEKVVLEVEGATDVEGRSEDVVAPPAYEG
ncbi:hypothetical protein HDV05_008157, partial [Chytridiales sp. JEL 0842]